MAGGPGGPIVGRVRLRVAPDLSGFRKKVERKLAGYDDFEMGITPDLGGFKKQVGRATRGMKASVAVGADTKGFREQMSQAMDRARAGKVNIQTGLSISRRGLRRQLDSIGKMIKSVAGNTAVVGGQIDWAMGGQASRRKMTAWLDQVRNKAGDAAIVLKELDTTPTVASANESIQEIERVIKGLKEIQGVRKALNRNAKNKSYNPQLHEEYLQLERMAKSLRGTNVSDSITDIDELTKRIREFGAKASDSAAVADRLGKHLIRARRGIDALTAASKTAKLPSVSVFNPNAVIPETADRRLVRRVKDLGGRIARVVAPVVRRINQTILTIGRVTYKVARGMSRPFVWAGRGMVASVRGVGRAVGSLGAEVKATAQLSSEMWDRMGQRLSRLRDRARTVSNAFTDMQAAAMGIRPGSGRDTDLVPGLAGAGPKLERELTRAFDNSGRSVERFKERTLGLGDVFRKLPGIAGKSGTSSFKKFWRNFHQSDQKKFGMAPGAWMVTAVTALVAPLSGLIGGALASLPALGLAAAAALGATVLGWEGIKEAAMAAAPAVEQAKEVLSGTFQDRLTPQFETLGEALGQITPDLDKVANGLADFSQGFVNSLSSEAGIGNMKELLGNTASMFSDLAPFAESFTDGLLIMGAAGSRAFEHLSESLNGFGDNFKQSMQEMADDGTLQSSIEATIDVLGSLGSNLGKVMRAGMEELPDMAESFNGALDSLGDGLVALMPLLADFSIMLFDGLGAAFDGIASIVPDLTEIVGNMGQGFTDAISGISSFVGDALSPLLDLLVQISPGMGDLLTGIGSGFRSMGEALSEFDFSTLGAGLNEMLSGLGEAIPNFARDMEEMITKWDDFSTKIDQSTIGKLLLDKAEEMKEGARVYGNVAERISKYGSGFGDAFAIAERELRTKGAVLGSTITEVAQNLKVEAERAAQATEIDLTPQIKALDQAKTVEDINRIRQEIVETIRGSSLTEQEVALMEMQLNPELTVDPAAAITAGESVGAAMEPAKAAAEQSLTTAFEGIGENLGASVDAELQGAIEQMDGAVSEAASGIGTSLGEALGGVEIPTEGLSSSISAALDSINQEIVTKVQEIGTTASTELTNMTTNLGTSFDGLGTSITDSLSGLPGQVGAVFSQISSEATGALAGLPAEISGMFTSMGAEVTGAVEGISSSVTAAFTTMSSEAVAQVETAKAGIVGAFQAMQGEVTGIAQATASGVQAALKMDLTASGVAVGTTFASGIRSQVGNVRAAAAELAAAARDNFPNSPAKIGPFSGSGWVDKSGIAVGMDFAKGMRSQKGAVADAAAAVVGAAKWQFDGFADDLPRSMENYQRAMILDPVMEANAKKIHDYRKREAENAERLHERIAKINEGKSKDDKKAEQVAKAQEDAAKRSGESYEKLLESLETPEYGDINRSFQSYWIDGSKDVLRKGLVAAIENADLAGRIRDISMAGVREGRRVFGTHPIFDQAEAAVNAEHFSRILQKVIEESGIAEIPIDFAMANLDQLKSDLGMGDGVISRAIDAAISTDPANTDARWARQNPVEIHYHVADMEEAIRLENERERKGMIKYKN